MKIALLGDIAIVGKYDLTKGDSALASLSVLANELQNYDYVVANLESPFTKARSSIYPKSIHLRTSPRNVEVLKLLNVDAVSLANNHSYDFGKKGLLNTISTLEAAGIDWFGVNGKYLVKDINGERVSISGFCCLSTNGYGYSNSYTNCGINTLTLSNLKKQLLMDRTNNAFSILSFHWGKEHTNYPSIEHVRLSEIISNLKGNVLIHGHHPHVIQGTIVYNTALVAYSLGNCIFDDCTSMNGRLFLKQNSENRKSVILNVTIKDSTIRDYNTIGFREVDGKIELFDLSQEMTDISLILRELPSAATYNDLRNTQMDRAIEMKFGKRDLSWLIPRLNYYSIGARLTAVFRQRQYNKEILKWTKEK